MRILITTFGTRGDIQPFIALAKGLQAAGHTVGLCTAEGFRPDIEAHNLHYVFMDNEMLELTEQVLDDASGIGAKFSIVRKMGPAIRRLMDDEWNAAYDFEPDLIIYHPKCLGSYHIAEKLGIPAILSIPLPLYTPTAAFPVPFVAADFGRRLNRLTYHMQTVTSAMYGGTINDFRQKTLGITSIGRFSDLLIRSDGTPIPVLYPISPHVVPVPPDYPAHAHMTGYWFVDHNADWQPDPALLQFLEAGATPIYIGFGSMSASNAKNRTRHIINAIRASGQRVVLASGWGDFDTGDFPDAVFALKAVPHDWLFPRVAAVVHHGGAGTTAAGLRAGKPTIICPFLGDQPFWGRRIHDLGVGTKPIPQHKINVDNLTAAIHTVTHDEEMQKRAAVLGEKIRAEDGIGQALATIETIANRVKAIS